MDLLGKQRLTIRILTPEMTYYGTKPPQGTPLLPCAINRSQMLVITVNEPHEEEAIAHTVVDPQVKPREDALNPQQSRS